MSALDLAGLGLAQTFQEAFLLAEGETDRPVYERPDPTLSTSSTIGNRYGFHGRPIDPETGLLYFRNRYYDPDLGRFVTSDPMGYVDGPNTYQYALNNPMAFSDPLGLCEGGWDENGEICGPTLEEWGEFGKGLGKGLWNRAKDTATGLVDAVLHPAETAEDLVGVLVDPSSVSDALETGLLGLAKGIASSDPGEVGDAVAGVLFDPAVAAVTGGTVAAVAKVSKVAHRATRVARGARAARAAQWGRRADGAGSKFGNYSNHGGEFLDDALRFPDVGGQGGGVPRGTALGRFDALARRAQVTDEFLTNKVLRVHGPGSSIPGKSRFIEGFDVRTGIRSTLDSGESLMLPNTQGRSGAIFIREFGETIGTNARGNPVTRLKVVFGDDGQLITAFPIR